MGKRRAYRPKLNKLKDHIKSDARCCFCGQVRNVPAGRHDGLCASCYFDFNEDDVVLGVFQWGREVCMSD